MDAAALEWISETVVDDVADGRASPAAVAFLLHRYIETGQPEIGAAVELALGVALSSGLTVLSDGRNPVLACAWLGVLADAVTVSDDERLPVAVQTALPTVIEALETFVRSSYEPGEGLVDRPIGDQLRTAVALVTAFELTGRLPYSMLAEELLQVVQRVAPLDAGSDFGAGCLAVQLWCRLAALHRDPEYAASAVVAPNAAYDADAARAVRVLASSYRAHPESAAEFGVALVNWFALNPHPN